MTSSISAHARVLATDGGVSIADRLRDDLTPEQVAAAAAVAETALIAFEISGDVARRFAAALAARGAFAEVTERRLVIAASRATLAEVEAATRSDGEVAALASEALRAVDAARQPRRHIRLRGRTLDVSERARVMGILNITPDSFYDRGRYGGIDAARERAHAMVALGADIIDIGGQSYAHWNPRIAEAEERARVVPVVEALIRDGIGVPLSIDTYKSSVAEAALDAGADLINDCSGLSDPRLAKVVAHYDAGLVVMHLKGELNVRASAYHYDDAMAEIVAFLHHRLEAARADGVADDALLVDPGLEFGKEPVTDLEILERFGDLRSLGVPILFAASRKSFIGRVFDRPAKELLVPSLATAAIGIAAGAALVRVHDVEETTQLARMMGAVRRDARTRLAIAPAMPGTAAAGAPSEFCSTSER